MCRVSFATSIGAQAHSLWRLERSWSLTAPRPPTTHPPPLSDCPADSFQGGWSMKDKTYKYEDEDEAEARGRRKRKRKKEHTTACCGRVRRYTFFFLYTITQQHTLANDHVGAFFLLCTLRNPPPLPHPDPLPNTTHLPAPPPTHPTPSSYSPDRLSNVFHRMLPKPSLFPPPHPPRPPPPPSLSRSLALSAVCLLTTQSPFPPHRAAPPPP